MIVYAISGLIAFLIFLPIQALVLRAAVFRNRVSGILFSAALVAPSVFFWPRFLPEFTDRPWTVGFFAGVVFTFCWFAYLQFYFLVERGVSLRILQHIAEMEEGLSPNAVTEMYPFDDVLLRRIQDMEKGGFLLKNHSTAEDRIHNSTKGHVIGHLADKVKTTLGIGAGG